MSKDLPKGIYIDLYGLPVNSEGVFGRDIAVEDFLTAVLRHGAAGNYRMFHAPARRGAPAPDHDLLHELAATRKDLSLSIEDAGVLKRPGQPFDVAFWHDTDAGLAQATELRARFGATRFPITSTIHVLSYSSLLFHWFLEILLSDVAPWDALICTSRPAKRALENIFARVSDWMKEAHGIRLPFRGSLPVIPLGVDTERFRPRAKAPIRAQLGLPAEAFLILWIGRLSPVDKADLLPLLLVVRNLVRANPGKEIRLLLGGSGEAVFQKQIADAISALELGEVVIFREPLPATKRHLYHACADVFVSPADNVQETFGITPIEAMASGVPQVVADWNGYRDTVAEGETGFRIPTAVAPLDSEIGLKAGAYDNYDLFDHFEWAQATAIDLHGYARALQVLIDRPARRAELAAASRKRAVQRYSWPVILRQHEALWEALSQEAHAAGGQVHLPRPQLLAGFFRDFRHYASQTIGPDTQLVLSGSGWEARQAPGQLLFAYEAFGMYEQALLSKILAGFALGVARGMGALQAELADAKTSAETVGRHIMWLMKYGYLRIWYPEMA